MAHATRSESGPPGLPLPVLLAVVLLVEALLVSLYFLATPADVTTPRYVVYPFVWINVTLWTVFRVRVPSAPRRHHLVAGAVAGAYFLVLANWAGLFGLTSAGHHGLSEFSLGLTIGTGSPGWERITYVTRDFYVQVIPFRLIGYMGLSYLVYVALLDVTGAVASGAVGLLSCLSCSFPIFASSVTGVWGGSVTLMSTGYSYAVDLSTVAFLVSVALLYWRPSFLALWRRRRGGGGKDSSP